MRSRASPFKWEYPRLSLRSSSSFLRLLPRLLVTSMSPFIFIYQIISKYNEVFVKADAKSKCWLRQFWYTVSVRIETRDSQAKLLSIRFSARWTLCWSEYICNPDPKTLEPEWPLHVRRATRVIAQQYSFFNILPLRFGSRNENFGTYLSHDTSIF